MSINKIMGLIGNILFTIGNMIFLLMIVAISSMSLRAVQVIHSDDWGDTMTVPNTTQVDAQSAIMALTILFGIILLCSIVANVFTWIAFIKIDGQKEKGWKIFLLVIGILTVFDVFAGVFFILAFALKGSKPTLSTPEQKIGNDKSDVEWSEVVVETSSVSLTNSEMGSVSSHPFTDDMSNGISN